MAYRSKRRKPVATELSRIVAKECDNALEELSGKNSTSRDEAVHEARKSVKKIRAVLRLLQKDLGEDYRPKNRDSGTSPGSCRRFETSMPRPKWWSRFAITIQAGDPGYFRFGPSRVFGQKAQTSRTDRSR
jgi:hypothetical protein